MKKQNLYEDLLDPRITDWEQWMLRHHIRLKPIEKEDNPKKKEDK